MIFTCKFRPAQELFKSVIARGMAVLLLLFAAILLTGCERYALDRKMEELCKRDGGIKVYETVKLSSVEYDELREYAVTRKSSEDYFGPDYKLVKRLEYIVGKSADPEKGKGRLMRSYAAIFRRSDDFLLGEQIQYLRSGGGRVYFWISSKFQRLSDV